MEDLIKLVPMNSYEMVISLAKLIEKSPVPYYVQVDDWKDNPLACVRLMQVAKAWEVRIYGSSQDAEADAFAVLRIEYDDDDHQALLSAYSTFNSIHEVLSVTQLQNAGFVI